MAQVLNPEDLAAKVAELSNRIANGVREVSRREADMVNREREFDQAWAKALRASTATNEATRKAEAVLATATERELADAARLLFNYAQRQARALEGELSSTQSVLKATTSMYHGGGVGHGA